MKLTIAIYSGEIPSTTFIERLINGLSEKEYRIYLFGTQTRKMEYNANVVVKTNWNNQLSKLFVLFKYTVLLTLFKSKEKKKLDNYIKLNRDYKLLSKVKFYPVLWYCPTVFHLQWAKGIKDWIWIQDFGMKLVVSLRGTHNTVSPIADLKLKKSYEENFPKIDGFHAVSKAIGIEAEKYGASSNKIHVVYSGLSVPPKLNLNHNENKMPTIQLLSVGRSHWVKGYNYALDACKLLKQKDIPFHYTIIGAKGVEELEYQKNDLGLTDSITLLGKLSYEKVLLMMEQSHIIILPSLEEGIANVVLEAMLLQKLVLTTNCGGMGEIVHDGVNGFVVPIRNASAISDKIVEISRLSNAQINTITAAARKTIESLNSEQKMVMDMIDLYQSVLNQAVR